MHNTTWAYWKVFFCTKRWRYTDAEVCVTKGLCEEWRKRAHNSPWQAVEEWCDRERVDAECTHACVVKWSVLPPCWPATSIPNAVCAVKVGCTPWYRRRIKRFAPLGPTCRPASLTGLLLAACARWQSALGRRRWWWWSESVGSRGYSR
jgi:hypothetical protein